MSDELKTASIPSLRRLPAYYRFCKQLAETGRQVVSCPHIARELHLDPTQVRKDLAMTGMVGKPRVGYTIGELLAGIEGYLGWTNTTDAFLAGAGNLGAALMGYPGFADYGLNIVAAFDEDPAKIGTTLHGRPVLAMDRLPDLAERMHVHIGIVTVPASAAQSVADLMVLSGIRAIWNFSPTRLDVPDSIILEHVSLTASLAVLTSRLAESLKRSS